MKERGGKRRRRERDEFKATITRQIMMRIIKMKNQCINLPVWRKTTQTAVTQTDAAINRVIMTHLTFVKRGIDCGFFFQIGVKFNKTISFFTVSHSDDKSSIYILRFFYSYRLSNVIQTQTQKINRQFSSLFKKNMDLNILIEKVRPCCTGLDQTRPDWEKTLQ